MDDPNEFVELHFPVIGKCLPADHGYSLYSALSRVIPELHEIRDVGIHTLPGVLDQRGKILLVQNPTLRIRMPLNRIPQFYRLAGRKYVVNRESILLGSPTISALQPSASLWARLVLIKIAGSEGRTAEPVSFLKSLREQLRSLVPNGEVMLEVKRKDLEVDDYARRVLRLKGSTLTGYGVIAKGLDESSSLRLQSVGLGGRRKMGCGLFVPSALN